MSSQKKSVPEGYLLLYKSPKDMSILIANHNLKSAGCPINYNCTEITHIILANLRIEMDTTQKQ